MHHAICRQTKVMPENTRAQMLPIQKKNEINERICTVISFASVNGLKMIIIAYIIILIIMDNENKQK
jgi:adenine C2-methylase RlmN of 23S rRNA A2503 and tRNA A37